jgi:5'-nucleotidase
MKNLFTLAATLAFAAITIVGCARKNTPAPVSESVTDINTAPIPPSEGAGVAFTAPTDAPAAAPQHAVAEPAVTEAPAAAAPAAGSSYTVKKGDTLFSIAKANYGNGNQWQKIVQANPGLSPTTLKAGKKITLP